MKREDGYYWVKYNNKWIVAECIEWWPTISDGSYGHRWLIPGKRKERKDSDMEDIDEHRIIREQQCTGYPDMTDAKLYIYGYKKLT